MGKVSGSVRISLYEKLSKTSSGVEDNAKISGGGDPQSGSLE